MKNDENFIKKIFFEVYDHEGEIGKSMMMDKKDDVYEYMDECCMFFRELDDAGEYSNYKYKITKLQLDFTNLYGKDDPIVEVIKVISRIVNHGPGFWTPAYILNEFTSDRLERKITHREFLSHTLGFVDELMYSIEKGGEKLDSMHNSTLNIFNKCNDIETREVIALINVIVFVDVASAYASNIFKPM